MKRTPKADVFEFTTFRQVTERQFAFRYVVYLSDGSIEKFTEKVDFPFSIRRLDKTATLLLQQLHLVLGLNYYKLHAAPQVKVPYKLDKATAEFWNKVYRYGLGEFAYKNRLNPQKLGNFRADHAGTKTSIKDVKRFNFEGRFLTGIGGGKDSLVAWELLQKMGVNQTPFACESPSHNNVLRREVIAELGGGEMLVTRIPSPKLEELRKEGNVYRGHTPMSVIVAFTAIFCAYVKKYDGFLVANESSSNEYNLTWRGIKVNHQWTKSLTFEKSLNVYLRHLGIDIAYMSVVRPMNELMITALFARMPKYHKTFFSCNKSRLDKQGRPVRWCGECAKCASATLLLAPFVTPKELASIIGNNMYANPKNSALFAELAGFAGNKPFECVCTKEEAAVILQYLHTSEAYSQFPVVKELFERYDDSYSTKTIDDLLRFRPAAKSFPANLARKMKIEVDRLLA